MISQALHTVSSLVVAALSQKQKLTSVIKTDFIRWEIHAEALCNSGLLGIFFLFYPLLHMYLYIEELFISTLSRSGIF